MIWGLFRCARESNDDDDDDDAGGRCCDVGLERWRANVGLTSSSRARCSDKRQGARGD